MSIFGKIKDAIFGKAHAATPAQPNQPGVAKPVAPVPTQSAQQQAPQLQSEQVDVDQVLANLAAQKGEKLNYRTSTHFG